MPFTLTHSHVASLFTFAAAGNPGPLLAEVDPGVAWRVGASEDKGAGRAGVYNVASFQTIVGPAFASMFEGHFPRLIAETIDVVGNRAYIEATGEGTTLKAGPYKNKVVMVLDFSPETGKVVRISEYLDTAVMWAAMEAHGV